MSQYVWAAGARFNLDPAVFATRYEALRQQFGVVTSERVLEDARPEDSPLHKAFEWDDRTAAEEYRRRQASDMLRCLQVVDEAVHGELGPVRYLISVSPTEDTKPRYREYWPLQEALADPVRREEVLRRAMQELAAFQAKYQQLHELDRIFAAIRQAGRGRVRRAVRGERP
jgi:hypothetical protein